MGTVIAMWESGGRRRVVDEATNVGAGCVIAELFLEDAPGFTAHTRQLFKSRESEPSVDGTLILGTIADEGVRTMAVRSLEMPQALKANGIFKLTAEVGSLMIRITSLYASFESIVDGTACARGRSLEEYILPLMIQALSDVEEMAVSTVLAAFTSLCELGSFQKMRIWELMSPTIGFPYHSNICFTSPDGIRHRSNSSLISDCTRTR
ncbi:hypothetical protein FIBSPDRAFT_962998 [Athelia psychrophila]|uniref:Phosphatase 2A Regulatory Subunit A helical domain-containing protein n=1 Tax=Athelia psychrophila TaxID=1759441 RepID=A0A165ZHE6_9AGAM|nr:hypothetical protein FIBSPDRAFT_962998 [Fibularhizoctonia sp. CBS 109695]